MFTGIVETVSEVLSFQKGCLSITKPREWVEAPGESIAVNGVCLTLIQPITDHMTDHMTDRLMFNVIDQTLRYSNLGQLQPGSLVNLERSLKIGDRMGGHRVEGHSQGTAIVRAIQPEPPDGAHRVRLTLPTELSEDVVDQGFIALDGMSLTVAKQNQADIEICLIPYTWQHTVARCYQVGSALNVEVDCFAKLIKHYLTVFLDRHARSAKESR